MRWRVVPIEDLPRRLPHEHANWLTVQVRSLDDPQQWLDYASIKDTDDLLHAARMLRAKPDQFRVVGTGY